MPRQVNITLSEQQLQVVLHNIKTKETKWSELARKMNITRNKLNANLIVLGIHGKKKKTSSRYFSWEVAKQKDFTLLKD